MRLRSVEHTYSAERWTRRQDLRRSEQLMEEIISDEFSLGE